MMSLVLAAAATTMSACSVEKPKQAPRAAAPAKPAAPVPAEVILPSPGQPPAEVQPAHNYPGDSVDPAPQPSPPKPPRP